jgi:hypothetical protein
MAKKHRSEKAAPLAAPDRTSANDVQDTPHVTKVAYPPNPAVPYAGQSLGYFWFFLATREWLQKRIVGVGMIVEGVPIFTRPLVYEMPSGAEDAAAENSEASVDGLTAITFKPEDVREIVDAEDGQNVAPGDGREVGVLADDRAMEIVDEYRRWQPTIDVLRRAMYRAGLIQPEARLTADVIRENLLNWLKSVCSLTEEDALQLPLAEVITHLLRAATPLSELLAKLRGERGDLLVFLWQHCPMSLGELAQKRWPGNPDEGTARRAVNRLMNDLVEAGQPDLVEVENGKVVVQRK